MAAPSIALPPKSGTIPPPSGAKPAASATPSAFRTPAPTSSKGVSALLSKHGGLKLAPTDLQASELKGARLTIILKGDKDASKSCAPIGIPRPFGGKTYVVSFDTLTAESLRNYYDLDDLKDVTLYEVARPRYDTDGKMVYPGYDPNSPVTAEVVVGTTMAILELVESKGDCDVLILDHFQALHEKIGVSYGMHVEGIDPMGRLEFQHYQRRTQVTSLIEAKARRIARYCTVLTGYGEEEDLALVKVEKPDPRTGNMVTKTEVQKVIKPPKWAKEYQRDYLVTLKATAVEVRDQGTKTQAVKADFHYLITVETSKVARFPKGEQFDITNKNLSIFWDGDFDEAKDQVVPEELERLQEA